MMQLDLATANQGSQAATLKLASASGVPFCEICEKLNREQDSARQETA